MMKLRWGVALVLLSLVVGPLDPVAGQSTENARPIATFHAYLIDENTPTTVLLDGTPSIDPDGTLVSYQWLFGDGTTGSGAEVEHTYPGRGEFAVTLVVIDDRGASHMTSRTIDLNELKQRDETSWNTADSLPRAPAPVGNTVGARAPEFTLPTLDGDSAKLSTYLGKLIVLDFWFQTCSACISTLPHLEEIHAQYNAQGLVIIVVVLDRDPSGPEEFFASGEYADFVVVHEHDASRPTRTAYGVKGTPHTFLIDRSGVIRFSGRPNHLTPQLIAKWV